MGTLGTRLGRTVKGKPCQAKLPGGKVCGSTERYRDGKSGKPGQCAPCARRMAAERAAKRAAAAVLAAAAIPATRSG